MPGNVAPIPDEKLQLLAFVDQQRHAVRNATYGLTDEQARLAPTAGTLTVGGLLKHVATTERGWIDRVARRERGGDPQEAYAANYQLGADETLDDIRALYDEVARETESVIAAHDLDDPVPVPKGVPWFPQDVDNWSVRWVLLHLIEETARHAGHADIVRESVDGAAAMPLMAAVEGWPASPWLQPWTPS
jgi:uncharacterized damage-inducible protein DinB